MVKHILLAKLVFLVVMIWQPAVAQMSLPTCTTAIDDTDNDGVDSTIDIDKDGDGLIEICDLEGLNEIRYQLDGSGYKTSADATLITDGCPDNGCIGYELVKSLDFDVDANYRSVSNKMEWAARADKKEDATNSGWIPIGESFASFRGIFEGNGYTISNLYMLSSSNSSGLYLELHAGGEIKNVGLSDVHIRGYDNSPTGSLVGLNGGKIINSYVASGTVTGGSEVGGLVGSNAIRYLFSSDGVIISTGTIVSSFAHVDVSGDRQVGGLVGYNQGDIENTYSAGTVSGVNATSDFPVGGLVGENGGSITNSYTMSRVVSQINNASFAGGLIGSTTGTVAVVTASYWDKTINAGLMDSANAKATMELQNPTAPGMTTTEVYYGWSSDDWDFGDSTNYPALRYATGPTENACNPDITISAMVPACATLLPNQSNRNKGLTGVFLLSGRQTATVTSLPKFSPLVFSYDIKIVLPGEIKPEIQLRPYAFNDDATIKITEPEGTTDYFAGKQSGQLSDPVSDKLAEEDETTLMIVVTDVINENTTTTDYTFKITRERLPFETTSIVMSPDPADVIAEGSAATITFMVSGGTENYEYEYFIDDVPLPSPSPSPFDFSIPDDLVEDDAALKAVTLKIKISEIGGASQTTEHTVNLMVQKVNNGSATIDITDMSGTLTATVGPDPDGDADDPGYVYQWQQRSPEPNSQWMDIMSATNASLVTDDSTKDYRVKVTYTDGQGYVTDVIGGPYRTNIDNDGDGLIEIYTLEDLDAIHIEAGSAQLEDEVLIMHGCPEAGCIGYELVRSLDFNDPNSYQSGIVNTEWTTGVGWGPLDMADFDSTIRIFEGNGYTISNLYINRTESIVGLFSILPVGSVVKNVGLLDVNIRDVAAKDQIGSLVGNNNGGTIINSYATGNIEGSSFLLGGLAGQNNGQIISSFVNISINGSAFLGGLVGWNGGNITNSYAIGEVNGSGTDIGGLVGRNTGSITYSYAANEVIGSVGQFGGLVGANDGGNIIASYWDSQVNENIISPYGISTSTVALQSPTVSGAKTMAIYYDWDDEVWDFGDSKHYPALRYAAGDNLNACNNDVRASFAVPACGVLLPNQFNRRGLATVFFFADDEIADIIMSPPFSSLTENYVTRVVTEASEIGLQPYAIQDGATIKITAQGSARDYFAGKQNGVLSDGIPLADGTTITIVVTDMVDGSPDNTTYTFAITRFTSLLENLEVEISPKNDDGTVNEGSDVTITVVEVNYGTGDYEYEFSIDEQSSPPQSAPFFMYTVPIDLVDAQNTTQAVALKIKVTDQHIKGDTLEHIEELTVRKVDSGLPAIDFAGTSKTLTVTIGPDPDDVSSSSTYEYEWQQQVPGSDSWASLQTMATDAATGIYNIPEDTPIGTRFRAAVTLSDGQNITMVIVGNYLYRGDVMDDNNNGLVDIYTLEDLDAIRNNLNASYELRANLDFNDRLSYADTRNMSEWAADEARSNPGWVPIPASGNFSFSGVFDGNGHTISNLYINTEGQDDKGLFSMLGDGGEIKNVRLLNIYVQGNRRVGGLVGVNSGTIISSHVTGTVRGSHNIVGGLVGLNNENKVISSFANVAVLGNSLVGGLAGQNFSASVVNSYAVGNVRGRIDVGGLVGSNIRNVDFDASLIINSYATGNVIGTHPENSQNIGGLVGYNGGQIENTYAEGAVSSYSRVGGLVGSVGGPITKSYAIGKVSGSIEMGGLAGYNSAIGSYITKSYWDIDTSGIETSAGGSSKTTVQLQSPTAATGIYNDWDINDWNFGDSTHYPALRYTEGGNLDACNTSITTSTVVPCRVLLPNQRDRKGLATIFFFAEHELAQVTLSQPFSPLTESYDIIIIIPEESAQDIQLSPYAINNNATIAITDQSGQSYFTGNRLNGALSDEIRLGDETTVTVVVTDIIDGSSANTTYTFTITKVRPLEISDVGISPQNDDGTINEGVDVTITVESTGGTGNNEYEFSIDGESLPPQSTPSFTYTVPVDLVDAQNTTRAVVLKFVFIDKGNEDNALEYMAELTVRKVDNGLAATNFVGTSKTLTVIIGPDPDDVSSRSTYEYQWQRQAPGSDSWTSIQTTVTNIATAIYNVPGDTPIGSRFRVLVTLSDGQNIVMVVMGNYLYRGNITDDNDNGLVDIYTLEDLDAIRNNPAASYELRADLDFKDPLNYADTRNMRKWIADETRSNAGWAPIPASGTFFGVFNGNGHTISNLYINTEENNKGLFSILGTTRQIDNILQRVGEIKNVGLLDVDVQGGASVGGLVGRNSGTIISSHVTGTVKGSINVGGLVGENSYRIISSFANANIAASHSPSGGLIGLNVNSSVVNSYALGNVQGNHLSGGLVGRNSFSSIINSYATGDITGTGGQSIGGLVGSMEDGSHIENTYAEGTVSGMSYLGGLVGKITSNNDEGTIINSYAISRVRSDSRRQVGGLVGSITGNYSITASYWDLNTSGITESAGGEGKTTEQLQSPTTATGIYSGWNTNDWNFGNSTHYPALHYTEGGDLSACNTDIEILADTPLCRILLPNQSNRKGLATVFFFVGNELAQATFFPPFSPHTESYDVITVIPEGSDPDIQLAPHAINDNATIAITDQDNQNYYAADRSDGTLSDIVTLGDETTLTIVVTDIMDGASTYTTYTFVIRKVDPITISRVMISAQPAVNDDKTINEGSTATIIFDPVGGIGNYQYFIDGQLVSSPSIVYKVPTDFIKSNSTITQTVILPSLVIRDESQEIVHTEELTIRKIDNGRPHPAIAFDTNPSQLRVFSAINDPDGEGVYTMQWQSKLLDQAWTAITDAIMATYQPPEDADRRTLYRAVNIKHTDAQGYQTEGYPTLGPFPILLSLTAEAPAILSRTDDFTYLLEVAVHADTVSLTPTASTGNVVYQVDDETETEVMNRVPFTATLAEDSQTVTITLARPNQDAQPLIYTINIERFLSANIKVFLEGLLK